MAGERLYSEFRDDKGMDWRVSIYDTNAVWNPANKESFVLGAEGFVIKYEGNNEQSFQPIIPSSVEFTLFEETADHTQTLDLLTSFPEGRLLLEIYKDPDGDNDIYWRGVILAEQLERADEPTPTAVRISAVDGLGMLKERDFSLDLSDVGTSGLQITKHIVRCFGALPTYELWPDGEPILRYINDTELHATDDDSDPLATILGEVPVKVDEDGSTVAYSCFDILSSLATCFNARVFLAEGVFWFWPLNVHKRISDSENLSTLIKQVDKDEDTVTWATADQIDFLSRYTLTSGTSYNKLAGHVFTHLPPARYVQRTRVFNGNQYVVRGNDDTIVTSGVNITLADTDRTYEVGSKFRVSGYLEFQTNADGNFTFNAPDSRTHIELEIMLNVDSRYYEPETWTTDSSDRYVIDLASFNRSNGTNTNTAYSFLTAPLATEEDGLDVTAVVKLFDEEGTNVTSSFTSDEFFLDLGVELVDDNGSNADLITYRANNSTTNQVTVDQGEVLFGDNIAFSAQGKLYAFDGSLNRVENDWKSSQTTGPVGLHRLGVNESLARQKHATKIHRGTIYGPIVELWMTLIEDSTYYVMFELSTVMNRRETTVERYKVAYDISGITEADDEPRALGIRGGTLDMIHGTLNTVTQQVQQPKPVAGGFAVTPDGGRQVNLADTQTPVFHRVTKLEMNNTFLHTIADDEYGYIYMSTWTGAAAGTARIMLPKVADNEGRMLRFKSDGTINSTHNYQIRVLLDEYNNGVTIDGLQFITQRRDYDGIAVLCFEGQWYVIQRKEK